MPCNGIIQPYRVLSTPYSVLLTPHLLPGCWVKDKVRWVPIDETTWIPTYPYFWHPVYWSQQCQHWSFLPNQQGNQQAWALALEAETACLHLVSISLSCILISSWRTQKHQRSKQDGKCITYWRNIKRWPKVWVRPPDNQYEIIGHIRCWHLISLEHRLSWRWWLHE